MAHIPSTSGVKHDFDTISGGEQPPSPKRPAIPTETGGTPHVAGSSARAAGLREIAADPAVAKILDSITGKDDGLAKKNLNLLQKRLGDGFVKMMTSPGVADMVRDVKLEQNFDTQKGQDAELAKRFGEASAIPLPANIKPTEFVVAPLDIMPFKVPGSNEFHATLLELNGTGYGNITTMEQNTLDNVMSSFGNVSHILKDEPTALFLVACSGREDPPAFGQSKKIHEKLMIANTMQTTITTAQQEQADATGVAPRGVQILGVDSFDFDALVLKDGKPVVENSKALEKPGRDKDGVEKMKATLNQHNWDNPTQPTVLVGYTAQLAKAIEIKDGTPFLNGRKVSFIGNDRLVLNINALNEASGKKLDTKKFTSNNISYVPAASKGHAYAFINQFNKADGANYPGFSREIVNEQASTLEEIETKVLDMLEQGKRVIIKPSGTGHGDGIRAFDIPEKATPESIRAEIKESYESVKGTYGDRGGFPYTISEYLTADRVTKEDSPLKSMKYEFRVAVYSDYSDKEKGPQLKAAPAIIKIDGGSKLAEGQSGDFSKQFASVSAQVLATGLPASEFMKPLCSKETMDLVGVSEAEMTELCKWSTRAVAHILSNVDQADSILNK